MDQDNFAIRHPQTNDLLVLSHLGHLNLEILLLNLGLCELTINIRCTDHAAKVQRVKFDIGALVVRNLLIRLDIPYDKFALFLMIHPFVVFHVLIFQ